jgi:hypothetical protein
MLVSKIQTYLSDKMHVKSYYKKHAILGLTPKIAGFLLKKISKSFVYETWKK